MFKWEIKTKDYVKNDEIYNKLKQYVNLVIEKNKEFNLTGFDEETIWLDGIYQSIVLVDKSVDNINPSNNNFLDIGAGAGFPSIPYLIFASDKINLTIYEPIKKRVDFLNLVKQQLNLKNLTICQKRIEDETTKEIFDYILARAVMPLNMLIEASSHVGKINCKYIFLKSKNANEELNDSKWIMDQLKIQNVCINNIDLGDNKTHNVVVYNKSIKTPNEFPRKWANIKKKQ